MSIKKVTIGIIIFVIVVWGLATLSKKESKYISWTEAENLFTNCKVSSVNQSQALDITLSLIDESTVYSKAPDIVSVGKLISANSSKCGEIQVSTSGY